MKGEINRDLYCSAESYENGACNRFPSDSNAGFTVKVMGCLQCRCSYRHRKWPTPSQFKDEYGEEYPDKGAVYVLQETSRKSWWITMEYHESKYKNPLTAAGNIRIIVCACTPFGRPDGDWRPE